ncbi:hypothetical protein ACWDYH_22920 [Nocardia goodfellowii]
MSVETPAVHDQAWAVPTAWRSKVEPFRGRSGSPAKLNQQAAQVVLTRLTESPAQTGAALTHPGSHPTLVRRGAEYLAAPHGGTDPLGAAVCLAIGSVPRISPAAHAHTRAGVLGASQDLADYLVHAHGYGFAIAVTAALIGIRSEFREVAPTAGDPYANPANFLVRPTRYGRAPMPSARRLRALLAGATDAEYAAAVAAAARLRRRGMPAIRVLTSFLLPTEQDWVTTDLRDDAIAKLGGVWLIASVTEEAQAHRVLDLLDHYNWPILGGHPELVYSLAAHVGPAAARPIDRLWQFRAEQTDGPSEHTLSRILSHLPDDHAFQVLLAQCWRQGPAAALAAAADRFPARALRVLGSGVDGPSIPRRFRAHVRRYPELAAELAGTLPEPARRIVAEILAEPRANVAADNAVPAILLNPPWQRPRPKGIVLAGLQPPAGSGVSWRPGEPEQWLATLPREEPETLRAESPEVAEVVAAWLPLVSRRAAALDWLRRHPAYAARSFIPGAVGKGRKLRRTHGGALRTLAALGYSAEIRAAAEEYGAEEAVRSILGIDPAELVPDRIPELPRWLTISALPAVHLKAGGALSDTAIANLITLLMVSESGVPHAGLRPVREACTADSLDHFAAVVHDEWRTAGGPARDHWVWVMLDYFGGDRTIELLVWRVRTGEARERALDSLAAIGSHAALLALRELSEYTGKPALRHSVRARINTVATSLGLEPDQLADRRTTP